MDLQTLSHRFWAAPEMADWLSGCRRVAVAASGGMDSSALLWLMAAAPDRPDWAPKVVAAHVHHGLRGADADADQECVAALAKQLGVPFRCRALDPARLRAEAKRSGSLEDAARQARYSALRDIVRRGRCDALVLAHHQDDLAETFLMRLLRGSGLKGLAAFGPCGEREGMRLVRPLIAWTRRELRELALGAGIEWREDATNQDPAFLRNRMRHRVLPYLDHHTDHPPVSRVLARTARLLGREGEAVDTFTQALYRRHRLERARPRRLGLPRTILTEGDAAVFAPYLLRLLITDLLGTAYPPSEKRTSELETFALSARPRTMMQSASNVVVWMSAQGNLWAYRKPRRKMSRKELVRVFERESSQ